MVTPNPGGRGKVTHPALRTRGTEAYTEAPIVSHGGVPTPPSSWSLDYSAKEEAVALDFWKRVWTFGGTSYTPENDYILIQRYVEMQVRRQIFLDRLEEEGYTLPTADGSSKAHPLYGPLERLEAQLFKYEQEIGLTVSARIRLGLLKLEEADELDKWEQKRNG